MHLVVTKKVSFPLKKPGKSPLYRVYKWHASDHGFERGRIFWEGDVDAMRTNSHGLPETKLPLRQPELGTITEFQVQSKGIWYSCDFDPRYEECSDESKLTSRIYIYEPCWNDEVRLFWGHYTNFLQGPGKIFMLTSLTSAIRSFASLGLKNDDVLIINRSSNDTDATEICRLAIEKHFAGMIYGFAETPRLRGRLNQIGCQKIFSKEKMTEFVKEIHRV